MTLALGPRGRRALAGVALALGALAAFAGPPAASRGGIDVDALAAEIEREADHVTALELAAWIRDRKPGLRVLDVRTDSEYAAYHIPSAEHVPLTRIAALRPAGGETLVLYSEGGAHAAQAWVLLRAVGFPRVYFLRGGLLDWLEDVMNPVLGVDADRVRALSRYFGGVPRSVPNGADSLAPRRDAATLVRQVRRRGC